MNSREVADLMEKAKARSIGGEYKKWYCRSGNKTNGVGIVLKTIMWTGLLNCGLHRISDRIIS